MAKLIEKMENMYEDLELVKWKKEILSDEKDKLQKMQKAYEALWKIASAPQPYVVKGLKICSLQLGQALMKATLYMTMQLGG